MTLKTPMILAALGALTLSACVDPNAYPEDPNARTKSGAIIGGMLGAGDVKLFAAAAAWFAPLPPAKVADDCAATVSPARGSARTRTTRSIIIEPTTCTRTGDVGAIVNTRAAYHAVTMRPSSRRQTRTAAEVTHEPPRQPRNSRTLSTSPREPSRTGTRSCTLRGSWSSVRRSPEKARPPACSMMKAIGLAS